MDRIGSYNVIAALARGGTGQVYLAQNSCTLEYAAIKLLDPFHAGCPEIVERLVAERDVSATARHPALVDIHAADTTADGLPYIVMEYVGGESLAALLERGLVSVEAIAAIGAQVANGVAALHAAGFVHCDLKPDNVLVHAPGDVLAIKVIDFGVTRRLDEPASTTIAGTPTYMAPEQWLGVASAKTDVYALGCMLYELAIGEPPFLGSLPELMTSHRDECPVRPSLLRADLAPELERVIVCALHKDPALRPTMLELARELDRFVPHRAPFLLAS